MENVNSNIVCIEEIDGMKKMANALLSTGHYKKLGLAGIFGVIQMAKSLGVDPIQALNGGLYPVDGKIEMDGRLMMSLIRQAGHSITKDKKSTPTHCILHGKRADTGDTWSECFGIQDAKQAGLLSRGVYQKYGRDMFQWRALSRLARFLFPDVIRGCYVLGEIKDAPNLNDPVDYEMEEKYADIINNEIYEDKPERVKRITKEQAEEIDQLIGNDNIYRNHLMNYLSEHYRITSIEDLPSDLYERVKSRASKCCEVQQIEVKEA